MDFEVYLYDKLVGRYNSDGTKEQYLHTLKLDTMFQHNAQEFLERRVLPKARWNQMARDMYNLSEWARMLSARLHTQPCGMMACG